MSEIPEPNQWRMRPEPAADMKELEILIGVDAELFVERFRPRELPNVFYQNLETGIITDKTYRTEQFDVPVEDYRKRAGFRAEDAFRLGELSMLAKMRAAAVEEASSVDKAGVQAVINKVTKDFKRNGKHVGARTFTPNGPLWDDSFGRVPQNSEALSKEDIAEARATKTAEERARMSRMVERITGNMPKDPDAQGTEGIYPADFL